MHRLATRWRLLALLTPVAVVAALALYFGGSAPTDTHAAGPPNLTGVSCSDVYRDGDNDTPFGSPPDADDIIAAASLNRIEPSQTKAGAWDITSVTYLGPDIKSGDEGGGLTGLVNDLIPDKGPGPLCADANIAANAGAENNETNDDLSFANQYGNRPGVAAKVGNYDPNNGESVAGDCDDGIDNDADFQTDTYDDDCLDKGPPHNLYYSTCSFSEALGTWVRTDVQTAIVDTSAKSVNYGRTTLYIHTTTPSNLDANKQRALDPTECDPILTIPGLLDTPESSRGILWFPSVIVSHGREASTDHVDFDKNDAAIIKGELVEDPDGPHPKVKGTDQDHDSADGLADDWDGDGCPDWDELDKNWNPGDVGAGHIFPPTPIPGQPQNGMDPFNPNDCDDNFHSNISIVATVIENTAKCTTPQCFLGGTGDGQYFGCRADLSHNDKVSKVQPLAFRAACYSDSTATVVNSDYPAAGGDTECPPAPPDMCGDGLLGISTPPFLGINPAEYPVLFGGSYDTNANTISFDVCLSTGGAFGPYVKGSGLFESHTMAGTFSVTIQHAQSDCSDVGQGPLAGSATIVELGSKKIRKGPQVGDPLPAAQHFDSDSDGCSDTLELGSNATAGGLRDPYNGGDWYDSAGPGNGPPDGTVDLFNDIFGVAGQFGLSSTDVAYEQRFDRGAAIPGGPSHSIAPADGTVDLFNDIFGAAAQFGHSCV